MNPIDVQPGMRIKVTQTITRRLGSWEKEVVGVILSAEPKPTGSWYAHGKDDKFWLLRLNLRKDDGEITSLSLDQNTRIEVLEG